MVVTTTRVVGVAVNVVSASRVVDGTGSSLVCTGGLGVVDEGAGVSLVTGGGGLGVGVEDVGVERLDEEDVLEGIELVVEVVVLDDMSEGVEVELLSCRLSRSGNSRSSIPNGLASEEVTSRQSSEKKRMSVEILAIIDLLRLKRPKGVRCCCC